LPKAADHYDAGIGKKSLVLQLSQLFDRPLPAAIVGAVLGAGGFAASELALGRTFGAAPVALANIAFLALITAGWLWAQAERRRQELHAATSQLATATARVEALQSQLPTQVARWQREAMALGRQVENFEHERARYEDALGAIASRGQRPVHHQRLTLLYEIGEKADGDRTTERYTTTAGDLGRPLLWHDVRIAVSGSDVPRLRSFRDLLDVQASQDVDGERFPIEPIPAGHIGPKVRALIVFDPPIDARPRAWSWSYRWPLWNPLRGGKQDRIEFEVLRNVQYDLLEIQVVFPRTAIRPIMRPLDNNFAPEPPQRDKSDRQTMTVRLVSPAPEFYSWTLGVEGFRDGPW